jgi:hypothetical protein
MTSDRVLSMELIAERLFELAESERETSALTAIQAYQAAASVLHMFGRVAFERMFEGLARREPEPDDYKTPDEEGDDESQAS